MRLHCGVPVPEVGPPSAEWTAFHAQVERNLAWAATLPRHTIVMPTCPACGDDPCTPACPEREWRYTKVSSDYMMAQFASAERKLK